MYKLKKSLGQHFLKDELVIKKIVEALQENAFKNLLEVGPGGGALTKELIKLENIHFKAVELDDEKVPLLKQKYPVLNYKIIHQDFLQIEKPFEEKFTIIGNFPYNISTEILFKILDWKDEVPVVIGMFQKEVAQRVAARPGNKIYGVTSALIQPFYDIEYLFDVPPESFTPPPKVMSGVIRLTRRKEPLVVHSEKAYKMLVKMAFNQRRKMLRNAVKPLFTEEFLQDEIFNKRAEALSLEDFAALTFKMQGAPPNLPGGEELS
ncbi:MAG: 16S rRNA (adenine(1518)-N(6)/adenine(1519)-N(6))-dimethyltransferase RsmA [Ferruginibacter sp.]|nr:16S rRNA (adenine(1518)-N(6)/adenine(1519)-N(6))-dimethyltransferase RsmA [Ferruginibacter sp.]